MSPITADATGKIPLAPNPWTALPISSTVISSDRETIADPRAKIATDIM